MRYGKTDRWHVVPKARRNGQPKTGAIKSRRFSQKLENALLRSYCKLVFIFYLYSFLTISRRKCLRRVFFFGGEGSPYCTAVFCKNLEATCMQKSRLWIWIYPWISTENLWIWIWMGNFISTASLRPAYIRAPSSKKAYTKLVWTFPRSANFQFKQWKVKMHSCIGGRPHDMSAMGRYIFSSLKTFNYRVKNYCHHLELNSTRKHVNRKRFKVIVANSLQSRPIFNPPLKKNCKGAPIPGGGALVRLGHSLARVKIWGRSTPRGQNMVFRKMFFGWVQFHREISKVTGPNFTGLVSPNQGEESW